MKVENSAPKQIDEENGKNECKGETAGQFEFWNRLCRGIDCAFYWKRLKKKLRPSNFSITENEI